MRVQIICKHTTAEQISEQLMVDFGTVDPFEVVPRRGHVLVEMADIIYCKKVIECCRQNRYAYPRIVEWEQGGSLGAIGRAVCVADLDGQPIKPITTGVKVNGLHGLFADRSGVIRAMGGRNGDDRVLRVTKFEIHKNKIKARAVADLQWAGCFEEYLSKCPHWYDQWASLMKAAVRKMDCFHCRHIHYQTIEDTEVEDGIHEDACSRR